MELQFSVNLGQIILAAIGGLTLWMVNRLMKQVDEASEVTKTDFPVLKSEVERNTADVKNLYKRTDKDTQRIASLEQRS
tara:strand:- start:1802 stop:2038 length:237 start_codon:yes stop_codon:yes gene_type:complete